MFLNNLFKEKETVGEPVLTMVKHVQENPRLHKLTMIGEHHLSFFYNGDLHWQVSVSHRGSHLHTCDTANWMNKAEMIYLFKELVEYAGADKYSRRGWMRKVLPDND